MDISFGKTETKEVIDENGSTLMRSKNIVKGVVSRPVRNYYEIKKRVTNEKEELEEYVSFSRDVRNDNSMLDPYFKIEHKKIGDAKGYYYVVWCFTRLEY